MQGIVKRFPRVLANDHVDLAVLKGETLGLLGENGAGKSTLMNVLYGLYHPDEGTIEIDGERVSFQSPRDAIDAGIGMVHQHFMLVPAFTVTENLILGAEPHALVHLDMGEAIRQVRALSERYGLKVDPTSPVSALSVGQRQRVEILKALYRGARIMILDEPTAVLTPQEVEELYAIIEALKADGHTFIFISHKLNEVSRITDRVTVMRDGRVAGRARTADVTPHELARMMVGRDVMLTVEKPPCSSGRTILAVDHVEARAPDGRSVLRDICLEIRAGEILGVAGVEGNGQTELVEVVAGLRPVSTGRILLDDQDVTHAPPKERFRRGLAHIPEDRHGRGLILDFSLVRNALLGWQDLPPFAEGLRLNYRRARMFARHIVERFKVRTASVDVPVATLSGGNQQKIIVGRELERNPKMLIAAQPTRGLDVGSTEFVHEQLVQQRSEGVAILLVSLELSEILNLSDRILVMYEGELVDELKAEEADETQLGLLMMGGRRGDEPR